MTTKAEVAKVLTEDIIGLISHVVEKRLRQILDEIETGVCGKRNSDSAVPEWNKGAPAVDHYAILHVPMRGYKDFCVIGAIDDTGSVHDMCGDNLGFEVGDIERWNELPAMLTQVTKEQQK